MNAPLAMTQALEVFLRGFSMTRSFVRPYPVRQIGHSLWLLADATSGSSPARTPQMVAYDAQPEEVVETRNRLAIERHTLCVLIEDVASATKINSAYKQLGSECVKGFETNSSRFFV